MAPRVKKATAAKRPTIRPERDWSSQHGNCLVAGIDEAGRGPLAGPVVAAAVIWDLEAKRPSGLNDSKKIPAATREKLYDQIQRRALAWGVGICHSHEIDVMNILEATREAARRAVEMMATQPGALVTDALTLPSVPLPQLPIIKGDSKSSSIAAASILAKVTRDRMMDRYHEEFPLYGWDRNRGYATADHYEALEKYGPTSLHRMTFNGVGFFSQEPLRSQCFHRLMKLLDATAPTPDAYAAIRSQVEDSRDTLPPLDFEVLMQAIAERAERFLQSAR
ncbi:ribonuclease HII [bacterium]|nr:ribonuclease HII [bacterium]